MLCCVVLCCVVLHYGYNIIVLLFFCIVLCYNIFCCVVLCCIVLHYIVLCCDVLCCFVVLSQADHVPQIYKYVYDYGASKIFN